MSTSGEEPVRPRHGEPEPGDDLYRFREPSFHPAHAAFPEASADAELTASDSAGPHPFTVSLLWTTIGTIIPGLGLWPTRFRKWGLGLVGVAVVAGVGLLLKATQDLGGLAAIATRTGWLLLIAVGAVVAAIVWVIVIIGTHLLTRPRDVTRTQRVIGAVAVGLLSFVVSAPLIVGSSFALDQRSLVKHVFKSDARSQTVPTGVGTGSDPWKNKPRLNILLLGGDSSKGRDLVDPTEGIRTDSMMLASIDTTNGNTTLIQLPRNLERAPFPKGSALAKAYPTGFWDGKSGENPEFELNAVWNNVPRDHPDLFKDTDYPGADALKQAVEGITGLKPDYFLLMNLDGMTKMINAMGGVTLNVNEKIPINQTSEEAAAGIPPKGGYIQAGPNQHLDGYHALWYARSRSQSTDYARMARQSCVVQAIVNQANPERMLTHYESIADAGKQMILTDIPSDVLPAIVELSLTVKDGTIRRILFAYGAGYGDHDFKPWDPDFALMHKQIQQAIKETEEAGNKTSTSKTSSSAKPSTQTSSKPSSSASQQSKNSSDVTDACAYHPGQ